MTAEWSRLTREYQTVVILDGFDEMSTRLDADALRENVQTLSRYINYFQRSKIVITSRSHFFDHLTDYQNFLDCAGRPKVIRITQVSRQERVRHLERYAERIHATDKLRQLKQLYDPIGLAAKPLFLQMIKETLPTLPSENFDELVLYRQYVQDSLEVKLDDMRADVPGYDRNRLLSNLQTVLEDIAVHLHLSPHDYISLRDYATNAPRGLAEVLWKMSGSTRRREFSGSDDYDATSRIGVRSLLKPVRAGRVEEWPVDFFHRSMREYFIACALVRAIAGTRDRAEQLLSYIPLQPEIVNFAVSLMSEKEKAGSINTDYPNKLISLAKSAVSPSYAGKFLGGNALTLLFALTGRVPKVDWSGPRLIMPI